MEKNLYKQVLYVSAKFLIIAVISQTLGSVNVSPGKIKKVFDQFLKFISIRCIRKFYLEFFYYHKLSIIELKDKEKI